MKKSPAARSMFIWAWGIAFGSVGCMVNPYLLLDLMSVTHDSVTLSRMISIMLGALAVYYFVMASNEAFRPLWLATACVRMGVLPLGIVLALVGWMDMMAVSIFSVDAIGGLWTALALRRS